MAAARRASPSSCEKAGRCAFYSTAAHASEEVCGAAGTISRGPPGARRWRPAGLRGARRGAIKARRRSTASVRELIRCVSHGVLLFTHSPGYRQPAGRAKSISPAAFFLRVRASRVPCAPSLEGPALLGVRRVGKSGFSPSKSPPRKRK